MGWRCGRAIAEDAVSSSSTTDSVASSLSPSPVRRFLSSTTSALKMPFAQHHIEFTGIVTKSFAGP